MISRRPVRPGDEEFLRRVYAGTRAQELAAVGWDDRQQAAFLAMQFDAQQRAYHQRFPVTVHVERDNPALRWYLRLGFALIEDQGVYLLLRRPPSPRP